MQRSSETSFAATFVPEMTQFKTLRGLMRVQVMGYVLTADFDFAYVLPSRSEVVSKLHP